MPKRVSHRRPAGRPRRSGRRPVVVVAALLILLLAALIVVRRPQEANRAVSSNAAAILGVAYSGTATCATCHADQHAAWRDSQHEQAMAPATPDRVLGDFGDVSVTHGGTTTRFFRRAEQYWVNADGPGGARADFQVRYTFGVDPLQQYLIEMPDGRLQALSVAWDSRPADSGGQRWFHLYGDEVIPPGDELHWAGRQQNWNFMCADCHSTNVRKNYDAAADRFDSTWSDINVACESCHGPGSDHVAWARASWPERQLFWRGTNGLTVALDERAGVTWSIDATTMQPVRSTPRTSAREIDACAPCHSRRAQLIDGYRPGLPLLDFYAPTTMTPGLFHADGQQLDEVYVYTSFLESRMNHAGVTCSDCHDPHTARVRAPGNALCTQCHVPPTYESPEHHRHEPQTAGAQCVSCHMPERTYMVVDPRRDHSFRVPRPDLSVSLGVPNACTDCHTTESDQWAADRVRDWLGRDAAGYQTFAATFAADAAGQPSAAADLARLVTDAGQPPVVRASALERLARYADPSLGTLVSSALGDPDAGVRLAAVRALEGLAPRERLALAGPALVDETRAVRMEAARLMAPAAGAVANAAGQDVLNRALDELMASLRFNADRPESRNVEASILAGRGRTDEAIATYRRAIALAPDFAATYVNLADVLSRQGQEAQAEAALRDGLASNPARADLTYALGLSLVRAGRRDEGVRELERAARAAPEIPQFSYAYAVALHSTGQQARAIDVLEATLARHPTDRDSFFALATFHRDAGRRDQALATAERLLSVYPGDAAARALADSLR